MKKIVLMLVALMTMLGASCQTSGESKAKENMKTLIVYYSFSAGNTKGIAEKIQKAIGGDLVGLKTVKPYPKDYDEAVKQGDDEVKRGYQPALKPLGVNVADYDRIIVGTPTWWYKMAPAVLSFLSQNDFKGKIVVPFMTNAGWPGTVIQDMTELAEKKGAKVENGHEFRFSAEEGKRDRMVTSEKELNEWIVSLK